MTEYFYQAVQAMVGRHISMFSAMRHEGEILLILQADADQGQQLWWPTLVLPLSSVQYQDLGDDPGAPCRWMINDPLPKSLFDGTASRTERRRFGARKAPDVKFRIASKH